VNKLAQLSTLLFLALAASCSRQTNAPPPIVAKGPTESVPSFVNRVWRVASSTTAEPAPGTLYAFLSDGTLLVTSSTTKASLGMWTYKNNVLTVVEEGHPQPGEVLKLDNQGLSIRLKTQGEPVEITFLRAEEPMTPASPVVPSTEARGPG